MKKEKIILAILIAGAIIGLVVYLKRKSNIVVSDGNENSATAIKYPNKADLGLFDEGEKLNYEGVTFVKQNNNWQLA